MNYTKSLIAKNRFCCKLFSVIIIFLLGITPATADIPTGKVLFSVPYYATMGPNDIFTPVGHSKGRTFLIWIDTANRPWVTMYFNGVVTTVPLDKGADYTAFPDAHHLFSLGIDEKGYIHITGDMHYYPGTPANYLPARYANQKMMYWVSNQPYTNAGGFTFAGGTTSTRAIPGTAFVFGRFFNDKNGELYYSSMVRAYDNGTFLQGMGALGLYHYHTDSQTWDAIGGYAANANPPTPPGTQYYKVLFWEDSGLVGGAWFQDYQATFKFDNNNRLHLALAANVDPTLSTLSRAFYAMSPDKGLTWKKANGTVIPGLPLGGVPTSPNEADVVVDTGTTSGLPAYADVVADQNGNPAVLNDVWRRWNGTAWVADIGTSNLTYGMRGLLGPDGKLTFNETNTIYIRRTKTFTEENSSYQVQPIFPAGSWHFFVCISELGLQQTGKFYGLGVNDSNLQQLQVSEIDFHNSPLPSPWADADIGTSIAYGGAADFEGTSVYLRASGAGIATNADNLNFMYQPITGDKTIIAHIASQDAIRAWATTGVMFRESMAANASVAALGVSYNSGTQVISRNGTNTAAVNTNISTTPSWVKLVRAGNVFTYYYSNDGVKWTVAATPQTVVMAPTIYVGVAIWAYADAIHLATVDSIQVF
jgi:hypothetical protein